MKKMKNDSVKNPTSYLHTENMGAGYDRKLIIDGVTIDVKKGEIVTLIGPNGSGKSTVLRSIIGQLKLIGGAVFLEGRKMTSISSGELARKQSVLMTDRIKTELMTCYDIVATARYPYTGSLGLLTDDDKKKVNDAIKTVNAEKLADRDFNSISDGQKQRILLARCIAQEPELIVLDEPTSFLDIKYKIELLQILKNLAKDKGTAIIMSMHEIDFARHISDKAVCIGPGGIDRIGKPDEVLTSDYLCHLFNVSKEAYSEFFSGAGSIDNSDRRINEGVYVSKNGKLLRKGITTGTCVTAAAYGAVRKLLTGEELKKVSLITPSGESVEVKITPVESDYGAVDITSQQNKEITYFVIKDSGDDPDVTNGAKVYASAQMVDITQFPSNTFTDASYPNIFIAGGKGVGIVTKEGLEQPVGYPAINKIPRRMIFEAVDTIRSEAGYGGGILITLSVENGEELAAKTFNPKLGIEGGISILGTSGILEPMSEKAIVDTIETFIKQQAAMGKKALLVTPGLYGQNYVRNELGLSLDNAVKCSNFIGETIDMAASYGFEKMLLVGNLGKIVKLAAGIMNTHSRVADGRMDIMCTHLALRGGSKDMVSEMYECINTDAALDKLKEWHLYDEVIKSIIDQIHRRISIRAGERCKVGVMVYSEKYGFLGETESAAECLKAVGFSCGEGQDNL